MCISGGTLSRDTASKTPFSSSPLISLRRDSVNCPSKASKVACKKLLGWNGGISTVGYSCSSAGYVYLVVGILITGCSHGNTGRVHLVAGPVCLVARCLVALGSALWKPSTGSSWALLL